MVKKNSLISVLVIIALITTFLIVRLKIEERQEVPALSNDLGSGNVSRKAIIDDTYQTNEKEQFKLQNIENLEKEIRSYLGDNIDRVGLVYYDINSKKSIEINADHEFSAASTVKIPINMLMYDMIQEKKIDINEKILFQQEDLENGAGVIESDELEKPIAINTLSEYSIIYSDNIAINMLLRKVGKENRYNFVEKVVGHTIAHDENNTTPKDSFKILERLYLNPENNEYYPVIIENMKKTIFHDRIDKYIPNEIVAHKIGDYNEYINDISIVFKEKPYIFVIFTKDVPNANEIIGKVSKIIYDNQN